MSTSSPTTSPSFFVVYMAISRFPSFGGVPKGRVVVILSLTAMPGWGNASPSWGNASPSWGNASPSWGNASPSWGNAFPSWGNASPGWGNASPGWGNAFPGLGKEAVPKESVSVIANGRFVPQLKAK
jgi:N-glycosylase/DNA lyase